MANKLPKDTNQRAKSVVDQVIKRHEKLKVKPHSYTPTKAELEEVIKLNVKGKTPHEKAENLAKAIFHPANAQ